jgi:hypothetical protein
MTKAERNEERNLHGPHPRRWRAYYAKQVAAARGAGAGAGAGGVVAPGDLPQPCAQCPPGKFSAADSAEEKYGCDWCVPGRYQDTAGQAACKVCKSNKRQYHATLCADLDGAADMTPGDFNPDSGGGGGGGGGGDGGGGSGGANVTSAAPTPAPTPCPRGRYRDAHFSMASGPLVLAQPTSCKVCAAGRYGTAEQRCADCGAHEVAAAGSAACAACPAGKHPSQDSARCLADLSAEAAGLLSDIAGLARRGAPHQRRTCRTFRAFRAACGANQRSGGGGGGGGGGGPGGGGGSMRGRARCDGNQLHPLREFVQREEGRGGSLSRRAARLPPLVRTDVAQLCDVLLKTQVLTHACAEAHLAAAAPPPLRQQQQQQQQQQSALPGEASVTLADRNFVEGVLQPLGLGELTRDASRVLLGAAHLLGLGPEKRFACGLLARVGEAARCEANDLEPLRKWLRTRLYRGHDPFPSLRRDPFDTHVRQTVAKLCVALRSPGLRARCVGGGSAANQTDRTAATAMPAASSAKESCADLSPLCSSNLRWGSCGERFFSQYCCQVCHLWADARKPRLMAKHKIGVKHKRAPSTAATDHCVNCN